MDDREDPERTAYRRELPLPLLYRSVFVMRELDELSVAETAIALASRKKASTHDCIGHAHCSGCGWSGRSTATPKPFAYLGARCDPKTRTVMDRIRVGSLPVK